MECLAKKWYQSKMLWLNGISLLATIIQIWTGFVIPPALQGVILTLANIILRCVTNEGIDGVGE
jgi:hypothetical protein